MKIMVIAAHPDDEILGCGGTCAQYADSGHDVQFVILGEGVTSRYTQREQAENRELSRLALDCREAALIIGAKAPVLHNLPDNRFDSLPLLDVVKIVENEIASFRPDIIFTHDNGDLNVDHRITFQAVLTAARPVSSSSVKELYTFEIPSSTEWAFQSINGAFNPNAFFDITAGLQKKLDALSAYSSEMREFPHPRSLENIRAKAAVWGSVIGCEAAEAFKLVYSIKK